MARFISSTIATESSRATVTRVFNVPGSNSWTVPAGITCATFEIWSAGGNGGARSCCDCYHQGSGGGGGRYVGASLQVTPGTVYTLCIGCSNDSDIGNGCHYQCLGAAGQVSYVTGTGITTLCASAGRSGNNDCYMYCWCTPCCAGCVPRGECAAFSTLTYPNVSFTCTWNRCNVISGSGSDKASQAYLGMWSDAQAMYYPSTNGTTPWRNAKILTTNWCTAWYNSRAERQGWAGMGGDGSLSNYCCCCIQAGVGRSGLILIRY